MDVWHLKPGHKVRTHGGAEAEVLSESEDGEWVEVRYLEGGEGDLRGFGSEKLAHKDEIEALLGVTHQSNWGEEVAVVVHRVPESEESEEGYEAVTMKGVPHGVIVTGSDPDSAKGALDRLVSGLKAFGFAGSVAVEDATHAGGVMRYGLDV